MRPCFLNLCCRGPAVDRWRLFEVLKMILSRAGKLFRYDGTGAVSKYENGLLNSSRGSGISCRCSELAVSSSITEYSKKTAGVQRIIYLFWYCLVRWVNCLQNRCEVASEEMRFPVLPPRKVISRVGELQVTRNLKFYL